MRERARALVVGALLLSLAVPPASAAPDLDKRPDLDLAHPPEIGQPVLIVPCFVLDVTLPPVDEGPPQRVSGTYPEACTFPRVEFEWVSDDREGRGVLDVVVDGSALPPPGSVLAMAREVRAIGHGRVPGLVSSLVDALAAAMPGHGAQDASAVRVLSFDGGFPEVRETRIVVSARFHVTWGVSDCGVSRAEVDVVVNGQRATTGDADAALRALCGFRAEGATIASLAGPVASLAALVGSEASREAPEHGPHLAPAVLALRRVAAATALVPTEPASPPADPETSLAPSGSRDPSVDAASDASVAPATFEASASESVTAEAAGVRAGLLVDAGVPGSAVDVALDGLAVSGPPGLPRPDPADPAQDADADEAPRPRPTPDLAPAPPTPSPGQRQASRLDLAQAMAASVDVSRGTAIQGAAIGALVTWIALALYQRLERPAALRHPMRAALYAACGARGAGATTGSLARDVGVARKAAEHHLVYLARLDLLREDRGPRGERLFALPSAPPPDDAMDLRKSVLGFVRDRPGSATLAVARALGVTRPRADRCLKDLVLAGMLEQRQEEGARRFFVAGE